MPYCVYRIVNTLNDKTYVGMSTNPKKRMSAHFTGSGSKLLKEVVADEGRWIFFSQILECHEDEVEANRRMQTFIMRNNALYPFGYNKGIGGKGSSGHLWDIDQRAKITGIKNNRHKLTEAQVAAIYWDPRSRSIIAKQYGISTTMITKIKRGQAWKNITRWLQ